MQSGFILTKQQVELDNQTHLEFWCITDTGPVRVRTEPVEFVFFVRSTDAADCIATLQNLDITFHSKPLPLKDFQQHPCTALYFNNYSSFHHAREALASAQIETYESDIKLTDRFLMERFVYGSCAFVGQPDNTGVSHAKLKPASYVPKLKVLSLDIECSEHGELYSIGLAADGYQLVLMIGEPDNDAPEYIEWVENEKELLKRFVERFNQFDPDIVIGWSVVAFDFRLLFKRAKIVGVPLTVARDLTPIRWRESPRGRQGFLHFPGRMVLDGIDALKSATYQFDSFSLENVAQELLGVGKKTQDVDNRMAQINHDFEHNKQALAEYNLQDCILVLDIFKATHLLEYLLLRSQLTGLELDRAGGSVAAFTNLYLPKLHRAGYIAPNLPPDGGLASPGGYVMNSKPGLYQNVLVLDFKSLYPSIIRTFKIDPLGLIEGLQDPDTAIPGFKGAQFSRDKHFLPDIITELWRQRDVAKKQKDSARSQAIKILMNSFYGVLGSGGCRFYDTRLASSITMRGHEIMQITAKWIEDKGYEVIYGDTDSTFVWLGNDINGERAHRVGAELASEINTFWRNKIESEFQLPCHLELEFETYFTKFLMPTIRGSDTGSKKRYAGLKQDISGDQTLIFKGLETVRSDWTKLAKDFQTKLYEMVFAEEDVVPYIQDIVVRTKNGEFDDKLIYRKRLRQKLEQYTKNVPPHVRAARMADDINKQQGKSLRYQQKGWVEYIQTVNGPETIEHRTSAIDYDHYIEKQIQPIAEAILPFVNQEFVSITSAQLSLF